MYEINTCKKNPLKIDKRVALVYPNIYKTAMSNLGYQIVYNILNDRKDTYCERFTYPNTRSIETNSPLTDFDIIAFSLQYEEDYFNVLKILKKTNIPLQRKDRNKKKYPLIIAGGPSATSNPKILSEYIDIFTIGDGEKILPELFNNINKDYNTLKNIPGIYIPEYSKKTTIQIAEMNEAYLCQYPIITKTKNKELTPVFGESILLNISRGCSRGCRFCMSTYLYRPQRESDPETLIKYCEKMREKFNINKISLIGAAVSDYSQINYLIKTLENKRFKVSTPSMRIDSIKKETLIKLKKSGMKTLTLAPESIPQLRDRINKHIPDELIFNIIENAVKLGFNLKYYFLIGIPYEKKEDIDQLIQYIKKINEMRKINKKPVKMSFSINPLIPKPHTPIQWFEYDYKLNKKKIKYMKKELKGINIKFDSARMGLIQYNLSCGDENTGKLIEKSLTEKITTKEWIEISPKYKLNDKLPWDNINVRVKKEFLKEEYEKIKNKELTPWCEEDGCYNCGFC